MDRFFGVALASFVAVTGPAGAATLEFTDLYVFGDSLADVGRAFDLTGGTIPPTPPYFEGQFTGPDGPVWAEIVGDRFEAEGKPVRNYAIGGTTALGTDLTSVPPPLAVQIAEFGFDRFTGAVTPGSAPLATFWAGANDIFGALAAGTGETVARLAATAVTTEAASLAVGGIEDYLFFTLGDLSQTPRFAGTPAASAAQAASAAYDEQLAQNVALMSSLGLNASLVDAGGLLQTVLDDPSAFGFANVTDPCVVADGGTVIADCTSIPGVDPSSFVWWDPVHPGSRAHGLIADAVLEQIGGAMPVPVPVPLPASLPLSVMGFGLIWAVSRGRPAHESR